MNRSRKWCGLIGLLLLTSPLFGPLSVSHAQSAGYPNRPVTIISDAAPGSSPDFAARLIGGGLGKIWGPQVIVVNRPGANGSIAARAAADVAPDGYTLFMASLSTFVALPAVAPNLPLKLPRDFLPVGFTALQPMFVAVSPKLDIKTLPELIARAKKQPAQISIAVSGVGRLTQLTGELLQEQAGIKLLSVPYTSGEAIAISDLASGRVSMIIEGYSGIIGAVKAGKVKLIAVASPERLAEFPDLPTVAETIPGFSAAGWFALLAPKETPAPIISKASADLSKVMNDPDIKKRLAATGSYARAMTPDQTLAFVNAQQKTWAPVVQKISAK